MCVACRVADRVRGPAVLACPATIASCACGAVARALSPASPFHSIATFASSRPSPFCPEYLSSASARSRVGSILILIIEFTVICTKYFSTKYYLQDSLRYPRQAGLASRIAYTGTAVAGARALDPRRLDPSSHVRVAAVRVFQLFHSPLLALPRCALEQQTQKHPDHQGPTGAEAEAPNSCTVTCTYRSPGLRITRGKCGRFTASGKFCVSRQKPWCL